MFYMTDGYGGRLETLMFWRDRVRDGDFVKLAVKQQQRVTFYTKLQDLVSFLGRLSVCVSHFLCVTV